MDSALVARVALPLLLVGVSTFLLVRPVLRLRRESGVQVVTFHRHGAAGQRVGAVAFVGLLLGLGALAVAFALGGPEAVGAWPPPPALVALGTLLALAGVALVAASQRAMGASLRIGIAEERTELVQSGPFAHVRHPIFSGLLLLLAGVVLLVPGPVSVLLWLAALAALAYHTRAEERHLIAQHGEAYRRYAARTGRFLPGVGRLPSPGPE